MEARSGAIGTPGKERDGDADQEDMDRDAERDPERILRAGARCRRETTPSRRGADRSAVEKAALRYDASDDTIRRTFLKRFKDGRPDIIAKYEAAYPGVFKYENRDYPLETECGAGGVHGAACEAAVAVRLAKEKNLDKQLEATLFDRQSMSMTGADVKAALEEVTKISPSEFDSRYQKMLESVRQDVQLGQKVGITGTPTYFINGIRLGGFRPAAFDAVIAYELKKAGVTS